MRTTFRQWNFTLPTIALVIVAGRIDAATQTVPANWTLGGEPTEVEFAPFDSRGGLHQLTGVSLGFDGLLEVEVVVQNFSALELEPNEWLVDIGATIVAAFAAREEFEDGGPFFGLGGFYVPGITGRLSAGSGGTPFDDPTPGDIDVSYIHEAQVASVVAADSSNLNYFMSTKPLRAIVSPFQDFVFTPPLDAPDAFLNVTPLQWMQTGTMWLTYEFIVATGRPEDCNSDGVVDIQDLSCVCAEPNAQLHDVLQAVGLVQGDLDGDGEVALSDFLILATNYGSEGNYTAGDLDCSGTVEFADVLLLAANFGESFGAAVASVPEPDPTPAFLMVAMASGLWGLRQCKPRSCIRLKSAKP